MAVLDYATEIRHDGRLHRFTARDLKLPVCAACGEKVFTEDVDRQISAALRAHLKLLTPTQIRGALERIKMSQKQLARCVGIAEATISRWLNEVQIQSRAMDNLMRVFFAFPSVREALSGATESQDLGMSDVRDCSSDTPGPVVGNQPTESQANQKSWRKGEWNRAREKYRPVREVSQQNGTCWGRPRGK